MSNSTRPAILLVDDRPEQRLALTVLLEELDVEVVPATSGRDALRWLLQRDFALILLDVDMPDMDGFETAELIRQRKSCEHTPIIFVTAYGDNSFAARGYALGAVDYILAPVDSQVLKAKASVFLELYRKTQESSRHADSLRHHASQLRRLADAAIAIHAARSLEELLKLVADAAASIVGAHQVAVTVDASALADRAGTNGDGRYAVLRPERTALGLLGRQALRDVNVRSLRMTQNELDGHASWGSISASGGLLPLRGWLAAPLSSRERRPLGWIQLSEKHGGEFSAEDETMLVQLAQMASIAAENTVFNEAHEANQIKDQFLATLSHELRTPLQAILSWSQMLREENVDRSTQLRAVEVIERNARAQARLIEDLLDVSRIISGKLVIERTLLDLGALIDTAVEDNLPAANDKGIDIVVERAAEASVAGDPNRLRQVLANLFSNAIKFTPRGGRVTLRLDADARDAQISMSDTGAGISGEFLPHLFERFRQADSGTTRSHGGLGIGLAVVRHLVELHGGGVHAESDGEGLGSRFYLRLPLAAAAAASVDAFQEPPASVRPNLEGLRILLVEDDVDTRECLRAALALSGATVLATGSAPEAFDTLGRYGADVLLSDLAMPGEDGFSLIRRIRALPAERGGRIGAAALSAHVRPEERARAVLAGFDLHLAKPVEPNELAAAVRALASRDVY